MKLLRRNTPQSGRFLQPLHSYEPTEPLGAALAAPTASARKTIHDFDALLKMKTQLAGQLLGEIEQLKQERAFELARLAREIVQPTGERQMSTWNNGGHVNSNFADLEEMFK
jgi:hypothetical protein